MLADDAEGPSACAWNTKPAPPHRTPPPRTPAAGAAVDLQSVSLTDYGGFQSWDTLSVGVAPNIDGQLLMMQWLRERGTNNSGQRCFMVLGAPKTNGCTEANANSDHAGACFQVTA